MADVAKKRDWSDDLPPDLIRFISKKIPNIFDYIRFRSVCKSWRSSVLACDFPPPQLPWIYENDAAYDEKEIHFYSLSSGKTFTIPAPSEITFFGSSHKFFGSFHGYMFEYDTLSLFNPISYDHVHLPFPPPHLMDPSPMHFSPYPIGSGAYVVCVGFARTMLAIYGLSDKKWTYVECVLDGIDYNSIAIYDGKVFYSTERTRLTKVIDITTQSVVHMISPPEDHARRIDDVKLVETAGQILRVIRWETSIFKIYKMDVGNEKEQPRWIEIDSIGDQVFFLDGWQGFSVSSSDFPGFKGNCIYYFKHECLIEGDCDDPLLMLPYRYNIEDRTSEFLDCPFRVAGGWYIPMAGSELRGHIT